MNYKELQDLFEERAKKKRTEGYIFLIISVLIVIILFFNINKGIREYKSHRVNIQQLQQYSYKISNSEVIDTITINSLKKLSNELISKIRAQDELGLISDTTTRVILGIIGFFLIQIFLKLYRYSMEKSDFYYAISDSIRILEIDTSNIGGIKFDELVSLFLPNNISLETPDTPKLIDLSNFFKK